MKKKDSSFRWNDARRITPSPHQPAKKQWGTSIISASQIRPI
jgi:hypothetical protein